MLFLGKILRNAFSYQQKLYQFIFPDCSKNLEQIKLEKSFRNQLHWATTLLNPSVPKTWIQKQHKAAELQLHWHRHSRQERSLGQALLVPHRVAFALGSGKRWKELPGQCNIATSISLDSLNPRSWMSYHFTAWLR